MTKQVTEELIHQIAGMLKAAGWHAKADRQWEGLRAVIQHIARELTDEPCEPLPSMPIVCRQCGSTDTMPWPHSSVKSQGASRDASPADLVGALQDVVHTDPGPVRAGKAHRDAFSEFVCPNHGRVQQLTDSGDCPMCYQDRHAQRT